MTSQEWNEIPQVKPYTEEDEKNWDRIVQRSIVQRRLIRNHYYEIGMTKDMSLKEILIYTDEYIDKGSELVDKIFEEVKEFLNEPKSIPEFLKNLTTKENACINNR